MGEIYTPAVATQLASHFSKHITSENVVVERGGKMDGVGNGWVGGNRGVVIRGVAVDTWSVRLPRWP